MKVYCFNESLYHKECYDLIDYGLIKSNGLLKPVINENGLVNTLECSHCKEKIFLAEISNNEKRKIDEAVDGVTIAKIYVCNKGVTFQYDLSNIDKLQICQTALMAELLMMRIKELIFMSFNIKDNNKNNENIA